MYKVGSILKQEVKQEIKLKIEDLKRSKKRDIIVSLLLSMLIAGACFMFSLVFTFKFVDMKLYQILASGGPVADMMIIANKFLFAGILYVFFQALFYCKLYPRKSNNSLLQRIRKNLGWVLFVIYVGMLFFILFGGYNRIPGDSQFQLVPFQTLGDLYNRINQGSINHLYGYSALVGNFLLFIPLTFILKHICYSGFQTGIIMFILFIAIELLQVVTGRGIFDIDDIFAYCIGMAIGFLLYKFYYRLKLKTSKG